VVPKSDGEWKEEGNRGRGKRNMRSAGPSHTEEGRVRRRDQPAYEPEGKKTKGDDDSPYLRNLGGDRRSTL